MEKAWNEDKEGFTEFYGSDDMDASVLLMESYGFIDAKDPKFISTVRAVEKTSVTMVCYIGIPIKMILVSQHHPLPFARFGLSTVCLRLERKSRP